MSYKKYNTQQLLQLLADSDKEAFKEIYDRHWKSCFLYAKSKMDDDAAIQDICHDVFLSLWVRREVLQIANLEAWLIQSVKYAVIKQINRKRKLTVVSLSSDDMPIADNQTENNIIYKDLSNAWQKSIDNLFGKAKVIFQLSKMQHLSNKEIAAKMNLSEKAVEYYITKSVKILRLKIKSLE